MSFYFFQGIILRLQGCCDTRKWQLDFWLSVPSLKVRTVKAAWYWSGLLFCKNKLRHTNLQLRHSCSFVWIWLTSEVKVASGFNQGRKWEITFDLLTGTKLFFYLLVSGFCIVLCCMLHCSYYNVRIQIGFKKWQVSVEFHGVWLSVGAEIHGMGPLIDTSNSTFSAAQLIMLSSSVRCKVGAFSIRHDLPH